MCCCHLQLIKNTRMANPGKSSSTLLYVYELPYFERSEICKLLNHNGTWVELAEKYMKYPRSTILDLREMKNPSQHLLELWGHHNHQIAELFGLLCKMKQYKAMSILKPFVDPVYHVLIVDQGEAEGKSMVERKRDSKIGTQNFNDNKAESPVEKKIIAGPRDGQKVSRKIFNNPGPQLSRSNSDNMMVEAPAGSSHPEGKKNPLLKGNAFSFAQTTTLPQISFPELVMATEGWNPMLILGRGGFGTVFRGLWKNTEVAIKKIERKGPESDDGYVQQLQQLLRELMILNSRPHENILSLYAYSLGGKAPCLVYQFMSNGSLADRLHLRHGTQPLSWLQRHEIAKGTARGLQYLHEIGDKPLIHGDIKSANILLDRNFEPRIGDFGLAREGSKEDSMKISRIQGTRPYLPDEFLVNKTLSTKIDTYSYGIVMFELATGLPVYDESRSDHKYLKNMINHWSERNWDMSELMDRKAGTANKEVFNHLIPVGQWCSNELARHRPEMAAVFRKFNDSTFYVNGSDSLRRKSDLIHFT